MAGHRAKKGSNDFDTFYQAGRSVLTGEGIYYSGEYYEDRGKTSPFLYPPAAACFFALLAWMPLKLAAFIWNALNLLFLGLITKLILSLTQTDASQLKRAWSGIPSILKWVLSGWGAVLILDNLTMAQINIWVLFLSLASFRVWQKKHFFRGGALLGAAVMMKVTPLLFVPYFLIRKQWKFLAGFLVGILLLTLGLPSLLFGWEQNRIYHQQFLGRTLKPSLISWTAKFKKEPDHPFKKSAEDFAYARLSNCFADKNQSLEASLTRLFLKERRQYESEPYVLASVKKYHALPILGGGISRDSLFFVIRLLQGLLFLTLLLAWFQNRSSSQPLNVSTDWALGFLSLTLLSPALRSQQYIVWALPLFLAARYLSDPNRSFPKSSWIQSLLLTSFACFLLQASLYGRAGGMGTWANGVLWILFVSFYLKPPREMRARPHVDIS